MGNVGTSGRNMDRSQLNEQKAKGKPRLASIRGAAVGFNYSLHRDTKHSAVCEVASRTRRATLLSVRARFSTRWLPSVIETIITVAKLASIGDSITVMLPV